MNIAVGNDALWRRFCAALNDPDLGADARFTTNEGRVTHRADLDHLLLPALARHTRADLMTRLEVAGVPCGPVNDLSDVFNDPHVQARGVAVPVPHPTLGETTVTSPLALRRRGPPVRLAPPTPGQHTREVLSELGLSPRSAQPRQRPSQIDPRLRLQPRELRREVQPLAVQEAPRDRCPPGAVRVPRHVRVLHPDGPVVRVERLRSGAQDTQVGVHEQRLRPRGHGNGVPGREGQRPHLRLKVGGRPCAASQSPNTSALRTSLSDARGS